MLLCQKYVVFLKLRNATLAKYTAKASAISPRTLFLNRQEKLLKFLTLVSVKKIQKAMSAFVDTQIYSSYN